MDLDTRFKVDSYLEANESTPEQKMQRFYLVLVGGLVLVVLSQGLGWLFNDKTELTPDHSGISTACIALAVLAAIASAIFVTLAYPKPSLLTRLGISVSFGLMAFLTVFMVTSQVTTAYVNWSDFPASKLRTYSTYIWIWRAYQTHGKTPGWDIQTTPIWSNMNITEDDYRFMLAHRRPGDQTKNPDEISSKGYLCAKVTMQQAGRAVRVLHAGDRKLPAGTVVLCPSDGKNIFRGEPSALDY